MNKKINQTEYGGYIDITPTKCYSDVFIIDKLPINYRMATKQDVEYHLQYLQSECVGIVCINDVLINNLIYDNQWPIEVIQFGSLADWVPYLIDDTELSMGDMILINLNKDSPNHLQLSFYCVDDHARVALFHIINTSINDIISQIEVEMNRKMPKY